MRNWLLSLFTQVRKPRVYRIISLSLFFLLIVFISYLLWRDGRKLLAYHLHFKPALLGLSFIVECSSLLIAVPVWRNVLGTYGVHQPLREHIKIYSYSSLALILPGGIWSIVSRTALYQRLGSSKLAVTTASLLETLLVGVAAAGVYSFTTILDPRISLWKNAGIGVLFFILILSFLHPKIFNRLLNWALRRAHRDEVLPQVGFGLKHIVVWIGLEAVVLWIASLSIFALLASVMDVDSSMLISMLAAWAAGVAASSLLFWLPGTPVLRDGTMVIALIPSLTMPMALVFVLLVRVWSMLSLLLAAGLVWLFFDLPFHRKKVRAPLLTQRDTQNTFGSKK